MKSKIRKSKYKNCLEIELNKGEWAIVDKEIYPRIENHKWSLLSKGYAVRKEKGITILLHREIKGFPEGMEIDHINGNRLDNRLINLRVCTLRENRINSKPRNGKYKGIWFKKDGKRIRRWIAGVSIKGKMNLLGSFLTKEEAILAYNEGAKKYFGEFAKLNIL